jgi:putative ABC transport system permease protein
MVTPVRDGEVPLAGTHKDGGHGNLPLWALAPSTRFPNQVIAGRDLAPDDIDAVVVGRATLASLQTTVGESVSLAIDGRPTRWRVVGVVEGFGIGANSGVFASQRGLARAMGEEGLTSGLRIQTTRRDAEGRGMAMQALERGLRTAGIAIAQDMQVEWVNIVLRNHIAIVQGALQFLGVLIGTVGAFTLASAMSTSVVERSREFGVMQTLGAVPARVVSMIVAEGVFVGAISLVGALALGTLLSYLLGLFVGVFLFDAPLPLVISPVALGAWLLIALMASAVAAVYPAAVAARLTIRESLAYI